MRAVQKKSFVFHSPKPSVNLSFKEQSAPTEQQRCSLQQERTLLPRITQVSGGIPCSWTNPRPTRTEKLRLLPSAVRNNFSQQQRAKARQSKVENWGISPANSDQEQQSTGFLHEDVGESFHCFSGWTRQPISASSGPSNTPTTAAKILVNAAPRPVEDSVLATHSVSLSQQPLLFWTLFYKGAYKSLSPQCISSSICGWSTKHS